MHNVIVKNKMVLLTNRGRNYVDVFLIEVCSDQFYKVKSIIDCQERRPYIQMNNYSLINVDESVITKMLLR